MRVYLRTFGCRANHYDTETARAMIEALGERGGMIAILNHQLVESCIQRVKGFKEVLDAHNAYRAKHWVPALTWSTALAASAKQWANRCQFDHDDPNGKVL